MAAWLTAARPAPRGKQAGTAYGDVEAFRSPPAHGLHQAAQRLKLRSHSRASARPVRKKHDPYDGGGQPGNARGFRRRVHPEASEIRGALPPGDFDKVTELGFGLCRSSPQYPSGQQMASCTRAVGQEVSHLQRP